jgi:hypothetical protein
MVNEEVGHTLEAHNISLQLVEYTLASLQCVPSWQPVSASRPETTELWPYGWY